MRLWGKPTRRAWKLSGFQIKSVLFLIARLVVEGSEIAMSFGHRLWTHSELHTYSRRSSAASGSQLLFINILLARLLATDAYCD